jgi:tetratricopeptide (TPR) repeat protein/DNA-binding winged helix-turn-helix (wHTH) protein
MLLERPGEIVSREDLRQRLWPQGTHVDFEGSLNAVLKRLRAALHDHPEQPRFIETIPKRGYRFIAPVFKEIEEKGAPRENVAGSATPAAPPATPRLKRRGLLSRRAAILISVVFVALGGSVVWRRLAGGRAPEGAAAAMEPIPARRSIAVLGIQNTSENQEDAWLSTALSQMLSTELAAGDRLRLVSGEDVANLRASSPWSQTDTLGQATTSRIGTALNCDLLLLGSCAAAGKPESRQIRIDARLQDAATGEILEEFAEVGSEQDLFRIASRVGGRMRDRLGLPALGEADEPAIQAALPSNREAARFYAQGLMKLREFDAVAAKDLLLQAIAVDPGYPLAHAMLAQAWGQLGYDVKSREEAKRAMDLSAPLPHVDKMLVEGAYYESLPDPEKAISTYRALFTLFPDGLDYGLRLVTMLDRVGRREEVMEIIRQLRRIPPPAGDDARLDIWEAREISIVNGPAAALPLQRGMNTAAARGQKLIYADAKSQQCVQLEYSDHPDAAIPACREAYETFLAAGNRTRAASALRNLADRTSDQGQPEEALRLYERAIQMLQEAGSRWHLAAAENNMAILLEARGQLDRAEKLFRDVRRDFEEVGDRKNVGTALVNIADVQVARGDLDTAARGYQELIAASQGPDEEGYPVYRLAYLRFVQGRMQESRDGAERAIQLMSSKNADFRNLTEARTVLGDVLKEQGDFDGARRQYQESLATRLKLDDPGLVAQSRASLASLAIDEAHAAEAETDLRGALAEFEKENDVGNAVAAEIDLTRALLMQGKVEEARKAILLARDLSVTNPDPAVKLPVAIQEARTEFAMTDTAAERPRVAGDAREDLQSVIATAHRRGYVTFEFEARLALGELEMQSHPSLGRSGVEALEREAHERGLERISWEAARLLGPVAKADSEPDSSRTP